MNPKAIHLLLADDDKDDRLFFKEALSGSKMDVQLSTVNDGEQLMHFLTKEETALPDALFLDLNMPRKNGFECLGEIKANEKLKELPVIIYSTSFDPEIVKLLRDKGALHYICKPAQFSGLRKVLLHAIEQLVSPVKKEEFILEP